MQLPVPREGLVELGLTEEEIDGAVKRAPQIRGGRPWEADGAWFDVAAVERVLRALSSLRHTKGKLARGGGKPLRPDPWQVVWIIAPVFGWKHPDGLRVVREAYIEVPRKNGKTTISTGLLVVLLCADGEPGPEVYSAAVDRGGAQRILDDAKTMIRRSPRVRKLIGAKNLQARLIRYPRNNGIFRPLTKVAETAHGLNVSGAVIDELHVHKRRDLVDAITTGTGAREQPLIVIITTADEGDEHSIYAEYHDRTEAIADRLTHDPTHYGVVWHADTADDPFADETLAKCNPGAGTTVSWDYLHGKAEKARTTPSFLQTYKRLHLNLRARPTSGLIDLDHWDAQTGLVDELALTGRICYGGLDLSATSDLTALLLLFPPQDPEAGVWDVVCRFWVPEDNVDALEHQTQRPLARWIRDGKLRATEGNIVDYREVRREVHRLRDEVGYQFAALGYDPWNATETVTELVDDGFNCVPVRQGYASLSSPTKLLERLVLAHQWRHGMHPVLRWNAWSVEVKRDENDNVKPVKPDRDKSSKRIDGISAAVAGLYAWQREDRGVSVYEDRGLEVIG